MLGSFKFTNKKNIFFELLFHQSINIYNIFHPNLLRNAVIDYLIDQVNKPPLLIIINSIDKWEVEEIFNARNHKGKFQF